MTIIVASKGKTIKTAFAAIEKSRSYDLVWQNPQDKLPAPDGDSFLYVDVVGMDQASLKRKLASLEKTWGNRFGIIDAKNEVLDIAELFFRGAVDYLGSNLIKAGFKTQRLKRVLDFRKTSVDDSAGAEADLDGVRYSGTSWNEIREGEEYTFLMLYVGIDRVGDLRRKSSEGFLTSLRKAFLAVVQHYFAESNARLWMWKEDDGMLLIPFDGKVDRVFASMLLLTLNQFLIRAEELSQFGVFSWRLGLHLGNTVYQDSKNTGSIVSEDINFVFHLGGKFVPADSVACTGSIFDLLPASMQALFGQKGTFEGREVYILKRPQ